MMYMNMENRFSQSRPIISSSIPFTDIVVDEVYKRRRKNYRATGKLVVSV